MVFGYIDESRLTAQCDASLKTPNFPTLLFYVKVVKVSKNFKIISVIIQFHPYIINIEKGKSLGGKSKNANRARIQILI